MGKKKKTATAAAAAAAATPQRHFTFEQPQMQKRQDQTNGDAATSTATATATTKTAAAAKATPAKATPTAAAAASTSALTPQTQQDIDTHTHPQTKQQQQRQQLNLQPSHAQARNSTQQHRQQQTPKPPKTNATSTTTTTLTNNSKAAAAAAATGTNSIMTLRIPSSTSSTRSCCSSTTTTLPPHQKTHNVPPPLQYIQQQRPQPHKPTNINLPLQSMRSWRLQRPRSTASDLDEHGSGSFYTPRFERMQQQVHNYSSSRNSQRDYSGTYQHAAATAGSASPSQQHHAWGTAGLQQQQQQQQQLHHRHRLHAAHSPMRASWSALGEPVRQLEEVIDALARNEPKAALFARITQVLSELRTIPPPSNEANERRIKRQVASRLRTRKGKQTDKDKEVVRWIEQEVLRVHELDKRTTRTGGSARSRRKTTALSARGDGRGRGSFVAAAMTADADAGAAPNNSKRTEEDQEEDGEESFHRVHSALKHLRKRKAHRRARTMMVVGPDGALQPTDDDTHLPLAIDRRTALQRLNASSTTRKFQKQFSAPALHQILSQVSSWDFDVFELDRLCGRQSSSALSLLLYTLFDELDVFSEFSVPAANFVRFFNAIERGYKAENPYHNALHAADVVQNMYFFFQDEAVADSITQLDIFVGLVAAAIHDYAHPGTSNSFQIATGSKLALRYNDISVLENMHCAEAFMIMKRKDCDIFVGLSSEDRRTARDTIIKLVLGTDMSRHFGLLSDLETAIEARSETGFSIESRDDRLLFLKTAMHCADLGNPCKPPRLSAKWMNRVAEEFFKQGDLERKLGLPVSLMMDRRKPNIERSQLGFIDVIVEPLYSLFAYVCPGSRLCLEQLRKNKAYWKSQLKPDESAAGKGAGDGNEDGPANDAAHTNEEDSSTANKGDAEKHQQQKQRESQQHTNGSGANTPSLMIGKNGHSEDDLTLCPSEADTHTVPCATDVLEWKEDMDSVTIHAVAACEGVFYV